jgi:phenylpropionate dioxygenase-like ring-hydroxylating dioxygenase large terminal subunit
MNVAPYLLDTWYAAMWDVDLPERTPLARTILDEPLVFWRSERGQISALQDRCPHRFAPLSMGQVRGEHLRCGYHGLEFDVAGACANNPHPNRAVPPGTSVRAYAVVAKHSVLWIWMGEAPPDPEKIPDYSLFDSAPPERVSKRDYLLMAANYELIADNLLDLSHASFLHEGLLGNDAMVDTRTDVERQGDTLWVSRFTPDVPVPKLYDLMFREDGANVDIWTRIRWDAPGCLLNDTGACAPGAARESGTSLHGVHLLTPETATTTHYHFCAVRQQTVPRDAAADERIRAQLSELRHRAFEEQDRAMIEAQQRNISRSGGTLKPALLSVDAGIVRYHRIVDELRGSVRA